MGSWAVVTGASGGLGEALARELARRGHDLVLVARTEPAMQALASELRAACNRTVVVQPVDLAVAGAAALLCRHLADAGIEPDVLVNNAAFGMVGPFLRSDPDRLRAMLQLDVVSLTELTLLVGRAMKERGRGRILLVGSLASYSPTASMAAYGASKAYVLSLGAALHVEMAPAVGVTVLSPGIMETGFGAASGFVIPNGLRRTILTPARVARIGLDALFAGRPGVVAGGFNKVTAFSTRLFSRNLAAKLSRRAGGTSLRDGHGQTRLRTGRQAGTPAGDPPRGG